ncbi:MAG: VCBS repeat-containing protein, partial [Bacteroidota bacterium]
LLLNNGRGKFSVAQEATFAQLGLVTDALFTDYDNDGWTDLLVTGQGMPITLFANQEGTFVEATPQSLSEKIGWWNGLTGADFDHDGDVDYLATNLGGNHLFHQNGEDFVGLYGADFDGNGGYDLLLSSRALGEDGKLYEFPHFQRKDTEKQLVVVKDIYPLHKDFGRVTMNQFLMDMAPEKGLVELRANYLRSAWIENLGDGEFAFHALPAAAQAAPLFGTTLTDLNGDGYLDIIGVGNDYGAEVGGGRMDALDGICLLYAPETKSFRPLTMRESGLYVPGNARSVVRLRQGDQTLIVASENQGTTRAFRHAGAGRWFTPQAQTARLLLTHQDGSRSVRECYYGSGFLGQSSWQVWLPEGVMEVEEVLTGETMKSQ